MQICGIFYNSHYISHFSAHLLQQCRNCTYRPFATTLSQLHIAPICYNSVTTAHIAHLPQHCHNSKCVIFQERLLKVLKCYNFLWVQRRHNCSPMASCANCIMTLYLLKVHLQMLLSIPITQKCQILSCDTLVTNERYSVHGGITCNWWMITMRRFGRKWLWPNQGNILLLFWMEWGKSCTPVDRNPEMWLTLKPGTSRTQAKCVTTTPTSLVNFIFMIEVLVLIQKLL
jgi:hypothetical protein